jgi:hypothetical protein
MRAIVIGGGLAGSEAALQLAKQGINVDLYEMRPVHETGAAHRIQFICKPAMIGVEMRKKHVSVAHVYTQFFNAAHKRLPALLTLESGVYDETFFSLFALNNITVDCSEWIIREWYLDPINVSVNIVCQSI